MPSRKSSATRVVLSVLLVAACAAARAQSPATEPALSRTVQDTVLQWGPCPPFMPAGCEIAVLHGDPAKPNADVFFRVPGGAAIPAHWHTSAECMVLVSGEMKRGLRGTEADDPSAGHLRLRSSEGEKSPRFSAQNRWA